MVIEFLECLHKSPQPKTILGISINALHKALFGAGEFHVEVAIPTPKIPTLAELTFELSLLSDWRSHFSLMFQ